MAGRRGWSGDDPWDDDARADLDAMDAEEARAWLEEELAAAGVAGGEAAEMLDEAVVEVARWLERQGILDAAPSDGAVDLAQVIGRLRPPARAALARSLGLEAAVAADPGALAQALARPDQVAAALDRVDEDARQVLYAAAWLWHGSQSLAYVQHTFSLRLGWTHGHVADLVDRLAGEALIGRRGPPRDAITVPREVLAALPEAVLWRSAVGTEPPVQGRALRPPEAVVADVARLLGRLRLGAPTTKQGRLTKRAQDSLLPFVATKGHPALERDGRAWAEYDEALALPLALAAMRSLVCLDKGPQAAAATPLAERWLGLGLAEQWLTLVEAWADLLPPDEAKTVLVLPQRLAALPPDMWVDLMALADLPLPLAGASPWQDRRGDLPLVAATGYRLGALEIGGAENRGGLPWVRATPALRAWAGSGAPPALANPAGEARVTGAGEVVVPGPLASADWADLATFCEVVSLDRAAILRPTRASVAAATTAGCSVRAFIERLERLGQGPLPQAVRFQVEDWGRRRAATMRVAVLVEAPDPETAQAVETLAGGRSGPLERLGPGLWRLAPERMEAVRRSLAERGVTVDGDRLSGPLPLEGRRGRPRAFTMPWPGPTEVTERFADLPRPRSGGPRP